METKYKIITGATVIIVFVLLGFILKMQYDIQQKQKQIEQSIIEFKKLEEGIVRLESKYVNSSKDLEKVLSGLGVDVDTIKKDLREQGAQLEAVAVVIGTTGGYNGKNLPSDFKLPSVGIGNNTTTPGSSNSSSNAVCLSAYGYCDGAQGLNLFEPSEDIKIPFGSVTFDAATEKPWSLQVFPRKYYSVLSMSKDNNGRTIAHAKMMIESQGQRYTIGVNEAYYKEVLNPSRFYWWNPRITGGVGFGFSTHGSASSMVSLQFYPSSYASNKARPSWMFFGVGAGYEFVSKSPVATVAPVMYNAFPNSNLIQNLYVGPVVGMGFDGAVHVNGSMNIVF